MDIQEQSIRLAQLELLIKQRQDEQKSLKGIIDSDTEYLGNLDSAIVVLTDVLAITQTEIVKYIEDTVGLALSYVYGDEYGFKVEYTLKRNQCEVNLYPTRSGMRYDPKFSCGVGVVDVCSFALRLVMWSLQEHSTLPIFILDEPFKNVHGQEENERLGLMVKKLSELLDVQIIIVSGESALVTYADKNYTVKLVDNVSTVTQ